MLAMPLSTKSSANQHEENMSLLTLPFPCPGSSSKTSVVGGIPTKEFVFNDDTSAVQLLTMTAANWGTYDRETFSVLARVTLGDDSVSGDKWIWHQYMSGTTVSWYLQLASNGVLVFYINGVTQGNTYSAADVVAEGVETLIYCTYIYGAGGSIRKARMYIGTGDDEPAEIDDATCDPPNEGDGDIGFGGFTSISKGWNGTIHQPMFFAGGIPLVSEVGTADNPVDLSEHANLYSAPDADNLPTDLQLSEAWTNNNSVLVQTRS